VEERLLFETKTLQRKKKAENGKKGEIGGTGLDEVGRSRRRWMGM